MESSWVENPPLATVEKECPIASNQFIPASRYASAQLTVMPR